MAATLPQPRPVAMQPSSLLKKGRGTRRPNYTAEEFFQLELPEHEKWELVNGVLIQMP